MERISGDTALRIAFGLAEGFARTIEDTADKSKTCVNYTCQHHDSGEKFFLRFNKRVNLRLCRMTNAH